MPNYTEDQTAHAAQALDLNSKTDIGSNPIWMTGQGFICFKPYLDEPRKNVDGTDGKYEVAIAMPADCPVLKEIMGVAKDFKTLKFDKQRGIRMPFKKGNDYIESLLEDATKEEAIEVKNTYGGLADHIYFTAKTKFPLNTEGRTPQLLDEYGDAMDASKVDGGAIVRIQVAPFDYNRTDGKGVTFGLRSMQVLKASDFSGGAGADTASAFGNKTKPVDKEDSAAAFTKPAETKAPDTATEGTEPLDDDSMFS